MITVVTLIQEVITLSYGGRHIMLLKCDQSRGLKRSKAGTRTHTEPRNADVDLQLAKNNKTFCLT